MTRQEREEMFAKDFLVAEDLMKLCGCCRSDASQLIQEINGQILLLYRQNKR